jgi:hypothetical protein
MDAGGATDESASWRTEKSCGPDASMVGVKSAELSAGDGDNKARSPAIECTHLCCGRGD